MKNNTPRRKRLNQKARVARANDWIKLYRGKDIVKGYARWFGVDWRCALQELKLAGVFFTEEDAQRILSAYRQRNENKARRKRKTLINDRPLYDSDENFSYIAGYTSNGVPYGVPRQSEQDDEEWVRLDR